MVLRSKRADHFLLGPHMLRQLVVGGSIGVGVVTGALLARPPVLSQDGSISTLDTLADRVSVLERMTMRPRACVSANAASPGELAQIIDGKAIAAEIRTEVKEHGRSSWSTASPRDLPWCLWATALTRAPMFG